MNVIAADRLPPVVASAGGRPRSEISLSGRLTKIHLVVSALFAASVVAGLLWISQRHDQLARSGAREMVTGKIASLEQNQRDMNADNSIWTEAYEALVKGDIDWLYNNVGTAAMIGTVDLVEFVPSAGATPIGWMPETPPEGRADLVPADIVTALMDRLRGTDPASKAVVSAYARFDGDYWLLSATRVINTDGVPEGVSDDDIPRQIRGIRASNLASEIQQQFPLTDVHIAARLDPADTSSDSLPLDVVGTDVHPYLVWTPPTPGTSILRQIAVPLAVILLVFALAGYMLSRYATNAARRLESALVDAQAADRAKTEFLGIVSHELRTPMNGILGLGQVLESEDLGPNQRQLLSTMMNCARSQMCMIEALLDVTQIESGKRSLQLFPLDLSQLVSEIAEIARLDCEKKGLSLEVADVSESCTVLADEQAIRQIVTNLVDNATKFTERGGITVRVDSSQSGTGDVHYRIAVSDTGIGIDPANHERIFQRLTQLDGSATRAADGLGLGLPICRSLAEMMGGRITIESALGEGSTFIFAVTLPRAAAPRTLQAA